jgi:hypothetical protein
MQDCIVFYLAHHADFVDHAHPVFSLYTHDQELYRAIALIVGTEVSVHQEL